MRTNLRVLDYNGGNIDLVGETVLPIVYNNNYVYHNFLFVDGNRNNLFGDFYLLNFIYTYCN